MRHFIVDTTLAYHAISFSEKGLRRKTFDKCIENFLKYSFTPAFFSPTIVQTKDSNEILYLIYV